MNCKEALLIINNIFIRIQKILNTIIHINNNMNSNNWTKSKDIMQLLLNNVKSLLIIIVLYDTQSILNDGYPFPSEEIGTG